MFHPHPLSYFLRDSFNIRRAVWGPGSDQQRLKVTRPGSGRKGARKPRAPEPSPQPVRLELAGTASLRTLAARSLAYTETGGTKPKHTSTAGQAKGVMKTTRKSKIPALGSGGAARRFRPGLRNARSTRQGRGRATLACRAGGQPGRGTHRLGQPPCAGAALPVCPGGLKNARDRKPNKGWACP